MTAVALAACQPSDQGAAANGSGTAVANAPATTPAIDSAALAGASASAGASSGAATSDSTGLRVEVDIASRQLHVMSGDKHVAMHDVAVGSEKWPTQKGQWRITQVVYNPDWTPPDESWAEEREPRESGDPKNPLGRVQLIYDPPRTIHGTNAPSSIGKAVSHGSIRMRNADIEKLARMLMDSTGTQKDDAFFQRVRENRKTKEIVQLAKPVPIVVK
ncbi:MAG TPA: L,D-transpeptidase [Gemmatimonadaceae bacterium]|nr:L,D-transpeptidase [Gemmatimonadaceae bacterium]